MRADGRGGARDRAVGMDRAFARRDFLNGAAVALGVYTDVAIHQAWRATGEARAIAG